MMRRQCVQNELDMNIFNKLFNKPKVDCPRCLGKGKVDWDDIKRLNKELKWIPGLCAYCKGGGKVSPEVVSKVKVDTTYLTTKLSNAERNRLFKGDPDALQRATDYEAFIDKLIRQIEHLHVVQHLDAKQIFDVYVMPEFGVRATKKQLAEMLQYVEKVIAKRTGK